MPEIIINHLISRFRELRKGHTPHTGGSAQEQPSDAKGVHAE